MKKFGTKPKPSAHQVLTSWCLVEASRVQMMRPSSLRSLEKNYQPSDEDRRNATIAEQVLAGRTRMRLMVFHVIDHGFKPETFRIYDSVQPQPIAEELKVFGVTHEQLKALAWENTLRMIEKVIEATPAAPVVVTTSEEVALPESHVVPLNPAYKAS